MYVAQVFTAIFEFQRLPASGFDAFDAIFNAWLGCLPNFYHESVAVEYRYHVNEARLFSLGVLDKDRLLDAFFNGIVDILGAAADGGRIARTSMMNRGPRYLADVGWDVRW